MQMLQAVSLRELGMNIDEVHDEVWMLAKKSKFEPLIPELERASKEITPQAKLACFAAAYQIVNDGIELHSKKKDAHGADDCLPIFVYSLIKAEPTHLTSDLK